MPALTSALQNALLVTMLFGIAVGGTACFCTPLRAYVPDRIGVRLRRVMAHLDDRSNRHG